MSLTTDVLTLTDEIAEYFGGDYESTTDIEPAIEAIDNAFRATGITDGHFNGRLVILTPAQLDALGAALDGYTMHRCTAEHPHEGLACDGWSPDEAKALAAAEDALSKAAREG